MITFQLMLAIVLSANIYTFADGTTNPGEIDECGVRLEQMLQDGNAAFTGKFLHEAVKAKPGENTIMSALSVFTPLAQLALYAEGNTKDELLRALNLPNKSSIRCVFPKIIKNMRGEQNVILNVASKIYATDEYPLSKNFTRDTKEIFDAEAESVDFLDGQGTANRINEWVEAETNNRIKDIAKPEMFDDTTRLVLANAIYFLGNWTVEFDRNKTKDRPFNVNNHQVINIPMMKQQSNHRYGDSIDLDCKILEITYKGENFSFVIFLPNEIEGLVSLIDKLQDTSKFYHAYDSTREEEVKVYMPKIKIESEYNLIPIMQSFGIRDIVNPFRSNLTGILKEYEPLYISAAVQKAFVSADEEGTEAAAANVFVGARTTSPHIPRPIYEFKADRPFCFYILYKRNIIFSGTFVTKSKE